MSQDIGMEIEFARIRQGIAERNTVGISHVNIQVSKLPNGNGSQFVSFWQGNKT